MTAWWLGVLLAASAAACSGSGSSSATSPAATSASVPAPASSPAPATAVTQAAPPTATSSGNSSRVAAITADWEKFFSPSTPVKQKVMLLQNGSEFEPAIRALATTPLASGLAARVNAVVVNSATDATVSYNLTSSGADLLPNQVGTSVYQDGIWKVSDATFCGLLKLIGAGAPAACGAAG